ncbi:MAG: hypothetical protein ACETVY_06490 [Candidatus Bathyarchaeia archaeon]
MHRAFVEEAKAHERLLLFALGAEEEGFTLEYFMGALGRSSWSR